MSACRRRRRSQGHSGGNLHLPAPTTTELDALRQHTAYEAWFLDEAYELSAEAGRPAAPSELVYEVADARAVLRRSGSARIVIGDWREGFRKAGAPLIFVTSFKLLDMLIEWILRRNGRRADHRFQQKNSALSTGLRFPKPIADRRWLKDRLVALYGALTPLRGVIVHGHHFVSADGGLTISRSRNGAGPSTSVSASDIRLLGKVLVQVLKLVTGDTMLDTTEEKRLRWVLDELAHVHGMPSFGQLLPEPCVVKMAVRDADDIVVDLDRMRAAAARFQSSNELIFTRLELCKEQPDGKPALLWSLPWSELGADSGTLRLSHELLARFVVESEPLDTVSSGRSV